MAHFESEGFWCPQISKGFVPWLDGFWHFNKVSILFYSILTRKWPIPLSSSVFFFFLLLSLLVMFFTINATFYFFV